MKLLLALIGFVIFMAGSRLMAQSQGYSLYFGIKGFERADIANVTPEDRWFSGNKITFMPSAVGVFTSFMVPSGWRIDVGGERCRHQIVFKLGKGKTENGYATLFGSSYGRYWSFPIAVGKQFSFLRAHLAFVPQAGVSLTLYKNNNGSGGYGSTTRLVENTHAIEFYMDHRGVNGRDVIVFPFAKLGAELYLRSGMRFSSEFGYRLGTTKLTTGEIHYRVNSGPEVVRNLVTRGHMLWYSVGLQYPISRIWEKKKELFWKKKVLVPQEMTLGTRPEVKSQF
jgi:hypothetical protein